MTNALINPNTLQRFRPRAWFFALICVPAGLFLLSGPRAHAQLDQGTIGGVVQDTTGAVVPGAQVTLTDTDTGLVLQGKTNGSGNYVFSPLKVGHYKVSATAPGFATTSQENLQVDVQSRLNIVLTLKPGGSVAEVVVSTAPPLLQTQEGSIGQVVSTTAIDNTPLNGRNWVYIAHLTAGVVPSLGASRGSSTGDFFANGQRATQNDFILDGVDNNINDIDFMNGASYSVRPPPDALSEFKVDTSDFSAEFGHSAGAVLNASIKSGTNNIHGSAWEYLRNTSLDARDWEALTIPKYIENQFGATLGFPILKNKLFYFGDVEANRIIIGSTSTSTVPTALMRQGNFTELLNDSLTGSAKPIQLYQPNSGGTALLQCNGVNNVFCPSQLNKIALNMLSLYPVANANGGKTTNNFITTVNNQSNTFQWDQRLDWNITSKDQTFARLSYLHIQNHNPPALGPTISGATSHTSVLAENALASETHLFSPTLTNEVRFGYNWGAFFNLQQNYNNPGIGPSLGLGGIPTGPEFPYNGGLPGGTIGGISGFGTGASVPSVEGQNVYQILDNVTKIAGKHSLKFGINLQAVRMNFLQPPASRGLYNYTGLYTGNLGASFTGYGTADFLVDQMASAQLSNESTVNDVRWYRSGYFEDDWKALPKLTLNLGLRYDYYQPYEENAGRQANFIVTPPIGQIGTGTGIYLFPDKSKNVTLSPAFYTLMNANHVSIQYSSNPFLVTPPKKNFAPRIGFAYQITPLTVVRAGWGLFYGGLESFGSVNLGESYPFQFTGGVTQPACKPNNCPSDQIFLATGFASQIANGLQNFVSSPAIQGAQVNAQTAYTMNYNLTVERAFSNSLVGTVSYVGNGSRHLRTLVNPNAPNALVSPSANSTLVQPFPGLGRDIASTDTGASNYNSLQAKLQKRYASGLDFLATYTYSHAFDDSLSPIESNASQREYNLIPQSTEYTNSIWDVRHRFTFNGFYELPWGKGMAHPFQSRALDLIAGGWASSLTFAAQTGTPFSVTPNITAAPAGAGGGARTILVGDPFKAGGSADPSNSGALCAQKTRTKTNWYNPCAFANPLPGSLITTPVTGQANALLYLGGLANTVYGPGYERINMSIFKDFTVWREQYLQFRTDIFNVFNHATWNNPSIVTDNTNGGAITAPKNFQANTPDARFFQLSAKYVF